ncbi:CDP-glucose 4,6-dehydratase [bacterium]|nr:CDP-glucose 4,6-dehydratase [candidate division CSSED10-310 bacterium]
MVSLRDFYCNKKIFVTGNTGFKGSWLSIWLAAMGAKITGYSLTPPTNPSLFESAKVDEITDTFIADVRDSESLEKIMAESSPEIVFHLAAQPLVRDSYIRPVETYDINVMGTANILEAVRITRSVKVFVNITTDKVYENREWCWGYRENEPFGGYDPYSNSKACSELVTASYRSSFFNPKDYGKTHSVGVASVRAGNVIGGGDWATDRLIPDIVRSIAENKPVKIRNPYSIRPWQHVLEPLIGYLMLAKELFTGRIEFADGWNFGPDDSDAKEVEWIVKRLCGQWPGATYEVDKGEHPHEANYLKLDCSKAKNMLGWHPRWNLDTAITKIIEWTKAYNSGDDARDICRKQIEQFEQSSY